MCHGLHLQKLSGFWHKTEYIPVIRSCLRAAPPTAWLARSVGLVVTAVPNTDKVAETNGTAMEGVTEEFVHSPGVPDAAAAAEDLSRVPYAVLTARIGSVLAVGAVAHVTEMLAIPSLRSLAPIKVFAVTMVAGTAGEAAGDVADAGVEARGRLQASSPELVGTAGNETLSAAARGVSDAAVAVVRLQSHAPLAVAVLRIGTLIGIGATGYIGDALGTAGVHAQVPTTVVAVTGGEGAFGDVAVRVYQAAATAGARSLALFNAAVTEEAAMEGVAVASLANSAATAGD